MRYIKHKEVVLVAISLLLFLSLTGKEISSSTIELVEMGIVGTKEARAAESNVRVVPGETSWIIPNNAKQALSSLPEYENDSENNPSNSTFASDDTNNNEVQATISRPLFSQSSERSNPIPDIAELERQLVNVRENGVEEKRRVIKEWVCNLQTSSAYEETLEEVVEEKKRRQRKEIA